MPSRTKKHRRRTLASQADKYQLYLASVQEPSVEVKFFDRVFKAEYKRPPQTLREDFCGTAAICYEWVHRRPGRRAIGVDLDPEPVEWGRKHLTDPLSQEEQSRVRLILDDVRTIDGEKADVLAAQNFSFWLFKSREQLLEYFKAACAHLEEEGLMVLDMMGGSELLQDDHVETTRKKGFTYVWDQKCFNPITNDVLFQIHFRFKDGSEMTGAFEYDWRLWTIPEVHELLLEAGFTAVDVYWEDEDADGEGTGVFRKRKFAPADAAWIAYLVAVK
ncbi:MAG: class I SAM-dependent methyltransferase [Planctomycetes bacterium]|nr:class I SAM-dependent methyltransferase [Planctomycetota bacterium]